MCDQLELYVLNALGEEERATFEAHLASCSSCEAELATYGDAVLALALTAEAVKPPARLKMSVLSMTASEAQDVEAVPSSLAPSAPNPADNVRPLRRSWNTRVATAVMASAAAIVFFVLGGAWSTNRAEDSPQTSLTQTQQASQVWDRVSRESDSTSVEKRARGGGRVHVVYSPRMNQAVLEATNMPVLAPDRVYQLWFQRDGVMTPAGTVAETGNFVLVPTDELSGADAMGVTVEPAPGSDSPTTAPLVFLKL